MKNVSIRFTVTTNDNVYYATSHKMMVSFCKENDFLIDRDWDVHATTITAQNTAEKCGRGVYCVSA